MAGYQDGSMPVCTNPPQQASHTHNRYTGGNTSIPTFTFVNKLPILQTNIKTVISIPCCTLKKGYALLFGEMIVMPAIISVAAGLGPT